MNKKEWEELEYYERAWKLGMIMSYMNDEEAYYNSGWLFIWPDGEKYEECVYDFDNKESYEELERAFIRCYSNKESHKAGLYSHKGVPKTVQKDAHYWDEVLGLTPIEIVV